MTALVVIVLIIVFLIWTFSSDNSNGSTRSTANYSPKVYTEPTPQFSSPRSTISVTPTAIKSTPKKRISLVDGEYRYFQNHYIDGIQYTFGFPKKNCPDRRVWVGIDSDEIERISYSEAMRRIKKKKYISGKTRYLGSRSSSTKRKVGYCSNPTCRNKLRGNIYKKHCYKCWTDGHR